MDNETVMRAAITEMMTVQVADPRWDVAAALLLITASPSGDGGIEPIPVSDRLWSQGPAWAVLEALAHATKTIGFPKQVPDGDEIVGIALATEGWFLKSDDLPEEERQAAIDWCAEHSIADHPAGREVKMIAAVDRGGQSYLAQHIRWEHGWTLSKEGEHTGRIRDALTNLINAIVADAKAKEN